MSGTPKRSHEEPVHPSSKHPHEDAGTYPKLVSASVSNEYHMPYDIGQDSRAGKVPRDADRRSPLHSMYRMPPSSSSDSHADHPVGPEKRLESRDSKENRDLRFENRDTKTEKKEFIGEVRKDPQSGKSEKDAHVEGRGDDNKDVRHDRDSHNDSKGDTKTEKDGYNVASGLHLDWKDSKEYHRGKIYSDSPGASLEPWHMSRGNTQGSLEVGKESSSAEQREFSRDAHEAVGENKIDSKGDDRSKFKDIKRKDVKHRDWGEKEKEKEKERSDRRNNAPVCNTSGDFKESMNDRRNNAQVSNTSGDYKESVKQDRDVEKWEREKKDLPKEKENLKEREKDQMKRESWNGAEKDVSNNAKEPVDGSAKLPEQEIVLPEQKKQKDADSWKNVDKEARDNKRKEREADLVGDKSDKHSRCFDKESDDGCAGGEGAIEKEREVYNYSAQHRKRIQRSRGSPQVPNREPRFRSRTQDNEGSQGKVEVSFVAYKVGESIQELTKLWKEYESSQSQIEKNGESSNNGPTLEIRIPSEYVTATNRQLAILHNFCEHFGNYWGDRGDVDHRIAIGRMKWSHKEPQG
ncbi:zinc finger CCCH domain-containing protein 13-like [Trifolium pratense]|uniref:Zinc finger CCCH domain-containing protein 13-like n=1 Tax=Trifolium pratense TaxID=57577 RepID=A0A2K3MZ36_TRIPR|nr:zinc finger CCCH domain-containing protein 13-like [Trifolium pratense]